MDKQLYFSSVKINKLPEEIDSVNISLGVCSLFKDNEYCYTQYRLVLIVRKYLNKRSGIFTTDEMFEAMKKNLGHQSKQGILNKLTRCNNDKEGIPFIEKISPNVWKINSDDKILRYCKKDFTGPRPFRYKIAIPMKVLHLHREQYICYIKLCLGEHIDALTYEHLKKKLHPIQIPPFTTK